MQNNIKNVTSTKTKEITKSECIHKFSNEGFEINVYNNGLLINCTDYHAKPLFLDEKKLKSIGMHIDKRKTRKLEKWLKSKNLLVLILS